MKSGACFRATQQIRRNRTGGLVVVNDGAGFDREIELAVIAMAEGRLAAGFSGNDAVAAAFKATDAVGPPAGDETGFGMRLIRERLNRLNADDPLR